MILFLSPRRPARVPRAPLPPLPAGAYDRVMPWAPPSDPAFMRADAWGVTIEGLPWVRGASSEHPERCLSWFLDRWTPEWQERVLQAHAERGYTHFVLSAPDSILGNGLSIAEFASEVARVRAAGFLPVVFLGSKDYNPRDMSVDAWVRWLDPIMTACAAAAEFVPGWEWDLWNRPGQTTLDVARYVGQRAHAVGASCWLHFSTHVTSWFADGDPRGRYGFWSDLGSDVDGLLYQADGAWDVPLLQARLVDTLSQFGRQGNQHRLRLFEDSAYLMFSHDHPNEDDCNLRSYLACCTVDNVAGTSARVWGYGQGGRRPDGSPL